MPSNPQTKDLLVWILIFMCIWILVFIFFSKYVDSIICLILHENWKWKLLCTNSTANYIYTANGPFICNEMFMSSVEWDELDLFWKDKKKDNRHAKCKMNGCHWAAQFHTTGKMKCWKQCTVVCHAFVIPLGICSKASCKRYTMNMKKEPV